MHLIITRIIRATVPFFKEWGYVVLFLVSILESTPLIGVVVPGATLVIFGGLLSRNGILFLPIVILVSALGAWIGDVLSYFIGKHYGYPFLQKYGKYIFINEARLEQLRELIKKHRIKTIILGRFNSLTRSIGPFASGASEMAFSSYLLLSCISALLWASVHALVGVIFGQGIEALSHYISLFFLFAMLFSLLIFYSYRLVNRNHHVFRKYHVYTLIVNILSIFLFTSSLEDVVRHRWLSRLDVYVYNLSPHIQTPLLTSIMLLITRLADPLYVLVGSIALVVFMMYRKAWYGALLSFLSLGSGVTLQYMVKNITDISRPPHPLVETLYASFPSGHATMITIFAVLLFWAFGEEFKHKYSKRLFAWALVLLVFLVCFSRLYLRAHWTSDVVAGISLGLFSVTFFMLLLRGTIWSQEWLIHIFRRHIKPLE